MKISENIVVIIYGITQAVNLDGIKKYFKY